MRMRNSAKHTASSARPGDQMTVSQVPKMNALPYDLIIIGPAGQKAAIAAAKARKRVAVIDRTTMIGGVSIHTGTIPSKTVREAIFQLAGSAVNGSGYKTRGEISMEELSFRVKEIIGRETS